ncbi:MAG: cbb3-type cytochrome oxidase assembly protein CcoS [Thiobacillus sp.]|nr:cbb3-type cytochrome oxidase assembly protein CcoS [Thiobacillus sp.]
MNILLLLIPLSLILVGIIAWLILWSVSNGQFDDLEGPAYDILMDNDSPPPDLAGHTSDLKGHRPRS